MLVNEKGDFHENLPFVYVMDSLDPSSEVILNSYDIIFIRWIGRVGMLPDFSNDSVGTQSYKTMSFTLGKADGIPFF